MKNSKVTNAVGLSTNGNNSESENRIQTQCYVWFHNTYQRLRGLLNYNLGNSKNAIDGAKNKAMGMQAGRADMVLYYAGKAHHFEFKTTTGRQSDAQKEWQKGIESQGFTYSIIRSFEQFKSEIQKIVCYTA